MEADLLARLRANPGIVAVAGTIPLGNGTRPAVDWLERRSDAATAFPALVLQVIAGIGEYGQDGRGGLETKRVRLSAMGTTYEMTRALFRAGRDAIEPAAAQGQTRFRRSKLVLERDLPPEDLGGDLKIFRTVADFAVPFSTQGD